MRWSDEVAGASRRFASAIRHFHRRAAIALRPLLQRHRHGYLYLSRKLLVHALLSRLPAEGATEATELDVIEPDQLRDHSPNATIIEVEHADAVQLKPLRRTSDRIRRLQWEDNFRVPAELVASIPAGFVLPVGHIGPDRRTIISGFATAVPISDPEQAHQAGTATEDIVDLEGVVVSAVMRGHANYAHWMLQGLPRLGLVRRVCPFEHIDTVLIPSGARPYVSETLGRLGIAPSQVLEADAATPYRAERLVVARMPSQDAAGADWMVDVLRPLVSRPRDPSRRRLYVTRGDVKFRTVVNEADVVAALAPLGFDVVTMDGLSVAQQADLFSSAECIVGPHGAALANLIFARPGTAVVEILPANWPSSHFSRMSRRLGLHADVLMGAEPALPARWGVHLRDADILVDVDELLESVTRSIEHVGDP